MRLDLLQGMTQRRCTRALPLCRNVTTGQEIAGPTSLIFPLSGVAGQWLIPPVPIRATRSETASAASPSA